MGVVLVSATRASAEAFSSTTLLGRSLQRLRFDPRIRAVVAFDNQAGLPAVYNAGLAQCDDDDIVVFVHDDVALDDYHVADRLAEALTRYDVVGVAGNRRRLPRQPGWGFVDDRGTWDDREWLSGAVAHGHDGQVTRFGPAPADCELLDGLLLAARMDRLRATGVRFDPRFQFHLYDLDFCRSARAAGLRLGTWPLAVTHASGGNFDARWRAALAPYFDKWGE
jgi:GT2 family glycosyltransferase